MIIASPVMKHFPLERRRAPLRDKMRCRTVSETSDSECYSWILAMHLISGDMHSLIRIFIKNDHALNDCPDKLLTFFDLLNLFRFQKSIEINGVSHALAFWLQ
ncbi:hypothetical protein CDAR_173311 [Caerostris darwini]|uniref:Ycf2 n=1 Tax=Caerostris darwini TaxID=1538125 RepID=A0AAV4V0S0_9ARAC|nr:hypothetical protein CDAR_173311 [Caerostris darwini]